MSIKIPVTLWQNASYTTKFDFMNYAFAKLVVVWFYDALTDYFDGMCTHFNTCCVVTFSVLIFSKFIGHTL